jgi:hypothetical protein
MLRSHLTENTGRPHYKDKPLNAVNGNNRSLLRELHKTYKYTVRSYVS